MDEIRHTAYQLLLFLNIPFTGEKESSYDEGIVIYVNL